MPAIACLLAPTTFATLRSRSRSFAGGCPDDVPSSSDLTKTRESSAAPRTETLSRVELLTTSALKSSPSAMRAWVIVALPIEPSAPIWADPRIIGAPRSTTMLLSEEPSGAGLTMKVAFPGFPAGFDTPGTGLSTAAGVRSISTSALARLNGALSLTGSVPVSHEAKFIPRLARAAASSAKVTVAAPSSPAARLTSTWAAAPRSMPSPTIFIDSRSPWNAAVADSSFSSARNLSI